MMNTLPARTGARRQGGFSLVEILVALSVLGFLVVGLNEGVRAGLGLWRMQSRQVAGTSELDSTARLLRNLLSGIPMAPAAAANPGSPPVAISFVGKAGQLDFVADLPTGLGAAQRADITLALRDGRLMLLWKPHRHEQAGKALPVTETELLSGVASLEFAYWGALEPDSPASWLSQWNGPAMPQLIRVRLTFGNADKRRWPDMIVAPQLWTAES